MFFSSVGSGARRRRGFWTSAPRNSWWRGCCEEILRGFVGKRGLRGDVCHILHKWDSPEANVVVAPSAQYGSAGDRDDCVVGVVYVDLVLVKNRDVVGVGELARAEQRVGDPGYHVDGSGWLAKVVLE